MQLRKAKFTSAMNNVQLTTEMRGQGCDSRTRVIHEQGLKILLYAVFTRISAEFTCGIYTVQSFYTGYTVYTWALVFASFWCHLVIVRCVNSQSLLQNHTKEAHHSQKPFESSLSHRRHSPGVSRRFSPEGSSGLCLCRSVSLRAPFMQLQRAHQLIN
jgi:hypothetical protein